MYTGRRKAEEYRKNRSRHMNKGQRADRCIQEEGRQKNTRRTEEADT